MNIVEIIRIESENTDTIHLYPYKGGAWITYGTSAILLNYLLPNINCSERVFIQYGIKCPCMIIDSMSLTLLLENIKPIVHTNDKIEIIVNTSY